MPRTTFEKIMLTVALLLSAAALLLALLTPGFGLDNTLVYQGF